MDLSNLFSLKGRIALITGGSRNLGKVIARAYIAQGAIVYISSRKAAECDATAEELGPNCHSLPEDLSTVRGIHRLVAELSKQQQRLDILVNNAGAFWSAPFESFPEIGWDKVMDINLKSPFFLTQALGPMLKIGGSGSYPAKVINITSVDGQRLSAWDTYSYHASKSALVYLTKRLAAELIKHNIVVSSIAPGAFSSDMNVAARDDPEGVASFIPMGRIGTDEDISGAAIFLASRAGDYVVGDTITVDGGVVHASVAKLADI